MQVEYQRQTLEVFSPQRWVLAMMMLAVVS